MNVLADALTSVLAIVALTAGSLYGWLWLDPMTGGIGALVIARWSWSLIRDAGGVLLDYVPPSENLPDEIHDTLHRDGNTITDLHVWQLGPGHHGAIAAAALALSQETRAHPRPVACDDRGRANHTKDLMKYEEKPILGQSSERPLQQRNHLESTLHNPPSGIAKPCHQILLMGPHLYVAAH